MGTAGLGAPVVVGAIAVGATAVIGQALSDYASGTVSSTGTYITTGLLGAVAGAVSGGVGAMVEGAIPAGATALAKMGIVGSSGVLETLIENTIMGQKTTWGDLAFAFVASAGLFGVGDNLTRAFTSHADDVIGNVAGKIDNIVDSAAGQTDGLIGRVVSNSDEITYESILRALRHSDTPEGYAVAALLKRGNVKLVLKESHPSGLGGLYRFGTNYVTIYTSVCRTPQNAAGYVAHEVRHYL